MSKRRKSFNPYFEPVCNPSAIEEIYQLLPNFSNVQYSKELNEDNAHYLEAMEIYTGHVQRTVLRGLRGACTIISNAACHEGFTCDNYNLMNFSDLITLNLDLLDATIYLEKSVLDIKQRLQLAETSKKGSHD